MLHNKPAHTQTQHPINRKYFLCISKHEFNTCQAIVSAETH